MRSWKTQTWAPFLAKRFGWRETLKSYRFALDTPYTLFIRSFFTSYFSVPPQIEHDDDGLTARPNSVVSGLNNISSNHHQRDIQTSSRPERISGLGTIDEKAGTYYTYWMPERLSNGENICKLLASFISVFRCVPCSIEDEPL